MIKFDTRDKKPNLYHAAVFSVPAAVFLVFLLNRPAGVDSLLVCAYLFVYFTVMLIMLIRAFVHQLEYNPYSYNTIIYMGFSLFLLAVIFIHLYKTYQVLHYPDQYSINVIHDAVMNSASNYMLLSFPFIFVFSVGLCISNIALIRHEGRRFVNILGIILSFMLVAGALLLYRFDYYASGSVREIMIHDLLKNLFSAVYLYFECMMIGTIIADVIAAVHEPDKDKDFLIILGCGLKNDGTPTPLLQARIDRAVEFDRRQREETGKELIFIVSGGQGPDEITAESTAMKNYLMEKGIEERRIVEENQSEDTLENMRFSKEKIMQINPDGKVAFSTTNYHVFRSGLCARRVKMKAAGMGAPTKWYFWPNASVREFIGLLTEHRGKQALIFIGMIIFYTVMTLTVSR